MELSGVVSKLKHRLLISLVIPELGLVLCPRVLFFLPSVCVEMTRFYRLGTEMRGFYYWRKCVEEGLEGCRACQPALGDEIVRYPELPLLGSLTMTGGVRVGWSLSTN